MPRASAAGDPPGSGLVGKFGDLSTIAIEGCQLIPAERVREALRGDVALQVVSGPAAPMDQFIAQLKRDLHAAYLAGGFANASVNVNLDDAGNPKAIVVSEGRRYVCAAVRVEGAPEVAESLPARLTAARPPDRFHTTIDTDKRTIVIAERTPSDSDPKAVWKIGEPVGFDAASKHRLESSIRTALLALGHFQAAFKSELVNDDDGKTTLLIKIEDLGPRATIATVDVDGAVRNDPDAIIALCDLIDRSPVDLDKLTHAQAMLWESARFRRHVISVSPHDSGRGAVRVRIEVTEYSEAPKLTDELSEADQIVLKTAKWLEALEGSDQDIAAQLSFDSQSLDVVISARHGIALRTRRTGQADAGVVLVAGEATLFNIAQHARTRFPLDGRFGAGITYLPDFSELSRQGWRRLNLSAGINTGRNNASPFSLDVTIAPVVALATLRDPTVTHELRDGVLTIRLRGLTIRIDSATGALLDLTAHAVTVRFSAGMFTKLAEEMRAGAPDEGMVGQRALPSELTQFGFVAVAKWFGLLADLDQLQREQTLKSVSALMAALFEPAVQYLSSMSGGDESTRLTVPVEVSFFQQTGPLALFAMYGLWINDDLAPRGSWPWTMVRETCLVFAGARGSAGRELARIHQSNDTGPIAYLALAHSPLAATAEIRGMFARSGLEKLTDDDAVNDLRFLWEDDTYASRAAANLVRELRKMSAEGVQSLVLPLPQIWREPMTALADALRAAPQDAPSEAIPHAIRAVWDSHLRAAIEGSLRSIILQQDRRNDGRL